MYGLADMLRAAGQGQAAEARRLAAADQQHMIVLEDDGADADDGAFGIFAAHAGWVGI